MKQLQNNFTTPEQSKVLLELGVPADSADCYYSYYIKTYEHSEHTEILWHRPRFITEDNNLNWNARLIDGIQTYLPCWSVGRLIEMWELCVGVGFDRWSRKGVLIPLIEDCMEHIVYALNPYTECEFDFSKLED